MRPSITPNVTQPLRIRIRIISEPFSIMRLLYNNYAYHVVFVINFEWVVESTIKSAMFILVWISNHSWSFGSLFSERYLLWYSITLFYSKMFNGKSCSHWVSGGGKMSFAEKLLAAHITSSSLLFVCFSDFPNSWPDLNTFIPLTLLVLPLFDLRIW